MAAGAGRARHGLCAAAAARRYAERAPGRLRARLRQRGGGEPRGVARAYPAQPGRQTVCGRDRGTGGGRPARHPPVGLASVQPYGREPFDLDKVSMNT